MLVHVCYYACFVWLVAWPGSGEVISADPIEQLLVLISVFLGLITCVCPSKIVWIQVVFLPLSLLLGSRDTGPSFP